MLRIGDKVRVNVSTEATGNSVRKYNGKVLVVKRISPYYNGQRYYELYDADAPSGLPYGFAESWLQKLT